MSLVWGLRRESGGEETAGENKEGQRKRKKWEREEERIKTEEKTEENPNKVGDSLLQLFIIFF